MDDVEVPDDAAERRAPGGDEGEPAPLSGDPEAPEADALEQSQPVDRPAGRGRPDPDPEAPEADALEQAQTVPPDPAEEER